jgi:hypothetical protein
MNGAGTAGKIRKKKWAATRPFLLHYLHEGALGRKFKPAHLDKAFVGACILWERAKLILNGPFGLYRPELETSNICTARPIINKAHISGFNSGR